MSNPMHDVLEATPEAPLRALIAKASDGLGAGVPEELPCLKVRDDDGNGLVHLCCQLGLAHRPPDEGISLASLLSLRADVNLQNSSGETPLLLALRSQASPTIVDALISANADVSKADVLLHETPLMEVACMGDADLCQKLLLARADPAMQNLQGQTALDLALASGTKHLAGLLEASVTTASAPRLLQGSRAPEPLQMQHQHRQQEQLPPLHDAGPAGAEHQRQTREVTSTMTTEQQQEQLLEQQEQQQQHQSRFQQQIDQQLQRQQQSQHQAQQQQPQSQAQAQAQEQASSSLPQAKPQPSAAALQKRCQELGVPFDLLGTLAAASVLQEHDRLDALSIPELRAICEERSVNMSRCYEREELVAALRQLQIWTLLPLSELQTECRSKASHVVEQLVASSQQQGRALTKQELIEALRVATWGGTTKRGKLVERCERQGVALTKLESEQAAETLLQSLEQMENGKDLDLRSSFKKRGFALNFRQSREENIQELRQIVIWEHLSLSELRAVCKARGLAVKGEFRRPDLMQVLAAETWEKFHIPISKLSSVLIGFGLLDRISRWDAKTAEQLKTECTRNGLPCEMLPDKDVAIKRLTDRAVWDNINNEDLREVCRARNVQVRAFAAPSSGNRLEVSRKEREERRELIEALLESIENEVWASKGVDINRLPDRYVCESVYGGIERLESMSRKELEQEYEILGLPLEPNAKKEDLLLRMRSVLIWQDMPLKELQVDCKARGVPTGGLTPALGVASEEEKRAVLVERLLAGLCSEAWERLGIPVSRLESYEHAIQVVEEWIAMEASPESFLRSEYHSLGLPPEGLTRSQLVVRLRQVSIWSALQLAELRRECWKQGVGSAVGQRNDLIVRLAFKAWSPAPKEDYNCNYYQQQHQQRPTGRPSRPGAGGGGYPNSGKANSNNTKSQPTAAQLQQHFAALGLAPNASSEDVRKAYRRLALEWHPDKNLERQHEAIVRFRAVKEAYEQLSLHFRTSAGSKGARS